MTKDRRRKIKRGSIRDENRQVLSSPLAQCQDQKGTELMGNLPNSPVAPQIERQPDGASGS